MNKRYIIGAVIAVIIICTCIIPTLGTRISNEANLKGYVAAIKMESVSSAFSEKTALDVLGDYKKNGVTSAVISDISKSYDVDLRLARSAGLDIALMLRLGDQKPDGYIDYLQKTVDEYNVKYIVLRESKNSTGHKTALDQIISKNDITLVLSENTNQLSNVMPAGYDDYLQSANGKIMRSYETMAKPTLTVSNPEKATEKNEFIYYHMMNSAIDRNIGFFIVNQLNDGFGDNFSRARRTQNSIKRFCTDIEKRGYIRNIEPDISGYRVDRTRTSAAAAILAVIMCAAIIQIVLKIRSRVFENVMFILGILAFAATYILPDALVLLYPTLIAPVCSCFCYSLCLYASDKKGGLFVFAVAFGSLIFIAAILSALLAGYDYHLNNLIFRGVKLGLVMPVGFALVSTPVFMNGGLKNLRVGSVKASIERYVKKIKPVHIIIIAALVAAGGLYILRSGNSKISIAENQIRNTIAVLTGARPRTKEFLVCWPCLALFVYYSRHNVSKLLRWFFAVGASVLFASVTNTFCHVFTDVTVSFLRTVYGLIFSIPFILTALGINWIILKILKVK